MLPEITGLLRPLPVIGICQRTLPWPTAAAGRPVALLPGPVDRILICRFAATGGALTGAALLTGPTALAPIRADLNALTASAGSTCADHGDQVLILAGDGADVQGIDAGDDPACEFLNSPVQVADYSHTSLIADLRAVLAPPSAAADPSATPS